MSRRCRNLSFALVVLGVVVFVLYWSGITINPAGLYLENGGAEYFEIKGDWNRPPKQHQNRTVARSGRHLIISNRYDWAARRDIVPSSLISGDWDLVSEWRSKGYVDFRDKESARLEPVLHENPVLSYLHRLDDRRIIEYHNVITEGAQNRFRIEPDTDRLYSLAQGLLASYPDDLFIRLMHLDALAWRRDTGALAKKLDEWRPAFAATPIESLRQGFRCAESALCSAALSKAGRNANDLMAKIVESNLGAGLRLLPEILKYEDCMQDVCVLRRLPNRLGLVTDQTAAKVFLTEAILDLFVGRREEALQMLVSTYRWGQMMNRDGRWINRLVGAAIRRAACRGLETFVANACQSLEEAQRLWSSLELLNRYSISLTSSDLSATAPGSEFESKEATPDEKTTILTCDRFANAKFQTLRVAAAAKRFAVEKERLPRDAQEIASLFPQGIPQDLFTPKPLNCITTTDTFLCYSVGPDERDGLAAISYDPSNGTISAGDIVTRMPKDRTYPFLYHVHARSREELLNQFPNGLPMDPFGWASGGGPVPLRATTTTPVYIYSVGPCTHEPKAEQITTIGPDSLYDPTNGTCSDGILCARIPE